MDGRRPDKEKLVREIVVLLHNSDPCSVINDLLVDDEELEKELRKLKIEMLAILEDSLPSKKDQDE